MKSDEAKRVLLKMTATWPQRAMTKAEEGEWHDTMRGISYGVAIEAVEELRAASEWLPRHTQFISTCQSIARRRALARPALPGMTGPALGREDNLARVRALREQLRATTGPPAPPAPGEDS